MGSSPCSGNSSTAKRVSAEVHVLMARFDAELEYASRQVDALEQARATSVAPPPPAAPSLGSAATAPAPPAPHHAAPALPTTAQLNFHMQALFGQVPPQLQPR